MTENIERNPAVVEVQNGITALEKFAASYVVTTAEQYEAGAGDLQRVKGMQKKLEETRTSITVPMNEALKRVNAFFKGPGEKLAAVEAKIKKALGIYAEEQERIRQEEQRKADEKARKEREALAARAAKAEASGKVEKAEALQQQAATVVAPIIQREAPRVAGVQMRDVWKFEVTDASKIPREYLVVDESRIRKVVQALKGDANIPGVRVYSEKQIASSAA